MNIQTGNGITLRLVGWVSLNNAGAGIGAGEAGGSRGGTRQRESEYSDFLVGDSDSRRGDLNLLQRTTFVKTWELGVHHG